VGEEALVEGDWKSIPGMSGSLGWGKALQDKTKPAPGCCLARRWPEQEWEVLGTADSCCFSLFPDPASALA